jgi:hypothetical protein
MTEALSTLDVNERFAAERAEQIRAAGQRRADIDRRVEAGTLVPIGDGRYRVNDPPSLDHGEIWTLQDGQVLPQHGLDQTTGQPARYTAAPAWHQLGNIVLDGTRDIDEVLTLARIDFDAPRSSTLARSGPCAAATPRPRTASPARPWTLSSAAPPATTSRTPNSPWLRPAPRPGRNARPS